MAAETPFDPTRYLTRVNGAEYLEVKWRLVWLRDRHPDATVETELISHVDNTAIFRAQVQIPGAGAATGWGSESAGDFRDYLEKAETKAIGRALAALGFGTQFCPDHEFGASVGRVVDSPVNAPSRARGPSNGSEHVRTIDPTEANQNDPPMTQRQQRYMMAVAREAGIDPSALDERSQQEFGKASQLLSRREASQM